MFADDAELDICERAADDDAAQTRTSMSGYGRLETWPTRDPDHWPAGTRGGDRREATATPDRTEAPNSHDASRSRRFHVRPTRRQFGIGAAAVVLGGLVGARFWDTTLIADTIFGADLMRSGPLGEEALGDTQAPHVVINYASLSCPHCANFFNDTFPALQARYIESGKVRFILREFPWDRLALAAAVLARAVEPGRYFAFVEALLRRQREWTGDAPTGPLFAIANEFGFTRDRFIAAFADQRVIAGIDWVRQRAAKEFKVSATPTFFIDGKMHTGEMSLEEMQRTLQSGA